MQLLVNHFTSFFMGLNVKTRVFRGGAEATRKFAKSGSSPFTPIMSVLPRGVGKGSPCEVYRQQQGKLKRERRPRGHLGCAWEIED